VKRREDRAAHRVETFAYDELYRLHHWSHTNGGVTVAREPNNPLLGKLQRSLAPELRAHLQARLPEPMIPSAFLLLASLRLSTHGKVDRNALSALATPRPLGPSRAISPRTPLETAVARFWQEVLGMLAVG
jgi:hypothetical protein